MSKKGKSKSGYDPEWARAKKLCRLSMEDIRMAKELRLSPKSMIKNIPSPSQQWKAPVKDWIRELYQKHRQKSAKEKGRP